ncbi:hypothetical protein EPN15_01265, partial [Patescibacteria group bacterium]
MPIKIKKYIAFFILFFIIGGFAVGALPQPVKAQWATLDIPTTFGNIWDKLKEVYEKANKQIVATAFKKGLSTFLNKLAYDSAVYVAAGGSGQKSLVNPFSKQALTNLADSVAGGFIDELAKKSGFASALGTTSLCEPADLTVKANLLLSFKKPVEPPTPKCSLAKIGEAATKTANDNLLEITAGAEAGETDIISRTINQAFGAIPIKTDLNNWATQLSGDIKSYTALAGAIYQQHEEKRQEVADQSANALKNNEANITDVVNKLMDVINNRVPKCIAAIDKSVALGCVSSECADFGAPAGCKDRATQAVVLASNLLAIAAPALEDVQQLNRSISARAFKPPVIVDPKDIGNAFNPEANDFGQHQKIQEALGENIQRDLEAAKLKQVAQGPCKGVETPISGEVKTPASVPCKALDSALEGSSKDKETFTGTLADAFSVFTNTLTAKLMERYFKKGLSVIIGADGVRKCDGPNGVCPDKTEDILRSGASQGGKAEAEKSFGGLLTASIETGGQQDILSILAACPPDKPQLNNCIIDEPFRRAIEKQMTVKEAMEAYKKSGGSEGLDPKKPFGYIAVGTVKDEPDFKNGYPYRSMLYLRKYRIIPVGWELAAQYIKNNAGTYTLEAMVDGFDNNPSSPFFAGLVDPAWVLKSPTVFCARQGPGPVLVSEELQCEKFDTGGNTAICKSDDYQARKVSRAEWCADEQTCLEEGENGDCKRYGYCTLERNVLKLGSTQCDKSYASCDGYSNAITKANYTVLSDTLVQSDCNQSNVGCQWYCQDAPKMCVGGTRNGQSCGANNDCANIYCSMATCSITTSLTCSDSTQCPGVETCLTGARICINGDTPGVSCTTHAQCGRGVVDGSCEEGGVWSCKENTGDKVNLDRDVKKCEAKNAGCNQFIKALPGTNLIGNSGFEDNTLILNWTFASVSSSSIGNAPVHSGKNSLKIDPLSLPQTPPPGLYMGVSASPPPSVPLVVSNGFSLNRNKTYTASAWVYEMNASSVVELSFGNSSANRVSQETTQTSPQWERISVTVTPENMALWGSQPNVIGIYLKSGSGTYYIDDLQLEEGDSSSNYVQYGSSNLVHLNGKRITCEESEIGCKLYTPVAGGDGIPGVINEKDKCPAECSGYKQYRELPAFFSPSRGCRNNALVSCVGIGQCTSPGDACLNNVDRSIFRNFISKTALSCPASAAGCEEFTNLDTVSSGGEAKEYFTYLRQCAKPGTTDE